ncbi:MAG: hypothetical protein ACYDD5_00620 [Sulfuricurvum sp.]
MEKPDYCTGWFEYYLGENIWECCKGHDEDLGTHTFYKCLKEKLGWFHALYITAGGAIGAWVKYTSRMFKKV